jgi:hypothetical protein
MTNKELIKILKRFPKTAEVKYISRTNDGAASDIRVSAQVNEQGQWQVNICVDQNLLTDTK